MAPRVIEVGGHLGYLFPEPFSATGSPAPLAVAGPAPRSAAAPAPDLAAQVAAAQAAADARIAANAAEISRLQAQIATRGSAGGGMDLAQAKAQAAAEWDRGAATWKASSKQNYVEVRARELTGQFRVSIRPAQ